MSFIKTPRIFYHGFQIVCFSCRNALMRIVSQIYLAPFFVMFLQIWKSGKSPIPSPNIQQMFEQLSPNKFWGSVWVGFKKYRVGMPWCVVLRCPCLVLSSTLLAVFGLIAVGVTSAPIVLNTDFAPWKCVWIFVFSPFQAVKHVFFLFVFALHASSF